MDWMTTDEGEVTVQVMRGDGDCMFAALAHQLFSNFIPSVQHKEHTTEIRRRVVKHINSNLAEFKTILIDAIQELTPRYDDLLDEHNKVRHFLNDLGKPGFWGGAESLKATTEIYNTSIKIHQEVGTPIWIRKESGSPRTIQIAYRSACPGKPKTRNHYDSVIHLEPNSIENRNMVVLTNLDPISRDHNGWDIMMDSVQVQQERSDGGYKNFINIATWNIRGGNSIRKRESVNEALLVHNIDLACLQETHLISGTTSTENYWWFQSGGGEHSNWRGVAVLIKKGGNIKIMKFIPNSDSLSTATVQIGKVQCEIISVHVPDGNDPRASIVLGNLINSIARIPKNKHVAILGDFNAHISSQDLSEEERKYIGKNLKHLKTNKNGVSLKNIISLFKLSLHTSATDARKTTLTTWRSGRKESQLDHMLSNCKSLITGTRANWVKESSSDHKLIRAKMFLGKCRHSTIKEVQKIKTVTRRWNITNLAYSQAKINYREEIKKELALNASGQDPTGEEEATHTSWETVVKVVSAAASKTLSEPSSPMTPSRRKAMANEQQALFLRSRDYNNQELKKKHTMARKRLLLTKKDHELNKCSEFFSNIYNVHPTLRTRKAFQFLKQYKEQKKINNNISINKWEEILQTEGEQIELLEEINNDGNIDPPTPQEINDWIFSAKANTAPGIDQINMELLKEGPMELRTEVFNIIIKAWYTNDIPKDWNTTVQIPIPKVPNPKGIDDWRRISLCSVAYKLYAKFLLQSLGKFIPDPPSYQAAFQRNRSTDDHIFAARRMLEERWRMGSSTIIAALDLSKAFDTIKHKELAIILKHYNTPTFLINRIIKACLHEKTLIQWKGQKTALFPKTRGVKQGCPISPRLFTIALHAVIETTAEEVGKFKINNEEFTVPMILAYADDLLLIAEKEEEIEEFMDKLTPNLLSVGLSLNKKKCQLTIRNPSSPHPMADSVINIGKYSFNYVRKIKYLGIYITQALNRAETVSERTKKANKAVRMFIPFIRKFRPPWSLVRIFYNAIIVPAITYGLKTAVLTKENRNTLKNFEFIAVQLLAEFCHPKVKETSTEVLLRGKTINKKIMLQRIRYWGHIERRPENNMLRKAKDFRAKYKKVGRPCFTWTTTLNQDLERLPQERDYWLELTKNKEELHKATLEIYKLKETDLGLDKEEHELTPHAEEQDFQ